MSAHSAVVEYDVRVTHVAMEYVLLEMLYQRTL